MNVLDAITSRVSITRYRDEGVDREYIARIIDAARYAPSAGNMQTWEFIVVEDDDLKEKLAVYAHNQDHVRDAPVVIVILADLEKANRRYGDRGRDLYAIQETAAAMQNMLLAAHEQDLGAAWVGAFEEQNVCDLLNVPDRLRPMAIVTVGHPAEKGEQPRKSPITSFTYINSYGNRVHKLYDKLVWRGTREYAKNIRKSMKDVLGR